MIDISKAHESDFETIKSPRQLFTGRMDLSIAFTLRQDGEIRAIVGCSPFWAGVGTLWAVVSDDVSKCSISFVKACKSLVAEHCNNFNRVQAFVSANNERDCKFIESIGLEAESLMQKMAPDGSDLIMYRRIK